MSLIVENNVFESGILPPGAKPLQTKWVFKRKQNPDHTWKYKARLVVKGFQQRNGIDYNDTYAPTAKWSSLRIFITLCVCRGLKTRQLDVKTAFLYASLVENIWVFIPNGLREKDNNPFNLPRHVLRRLRGLFLKLWRSLYGLKQAPRNWFQLLKAFLLDQGFTQLMSESCLFYKYVGSILILVLVFVDDMLLACISEELLDELTDAFSEKFNIKDTGEEDLYLSISIKMLYDQYKAELDQTEFIDFIWKKFNFPENFRVRSPLQQNWKVDPDEYEQESLAQREYAKNFPYRSVIGRALFVNVGTRPDISYPVHYPARFSSKPTWSACKAAIRLIQYLYNTKNKKLILGGTPKPLLNLFCDTDWAACVFTRKSVECHLVYLGYGCIIWGVKQQDNVAHSAAEAEFCCLTPGTKPVRWVRGMFHELGLGYTRATACLTDNTTAQTLATNPVHHTRMKQLHLKYLDLRDLTEWGVIAPGRVKTELNPADIGIKPLGPHEFVPKAKLVLEGIEELEFEDVERKKTIENDASV